MSLIWREQFRIHFYDAEPGGRASVPAMCRLLQEAANSHTENLGISMRQVRERGQMWMLTRFGLIFHGFPKVGETITVETFAPVRAGGLRGYRDFRACNSEGEILCEAAALWLLLDMKTRRLQRMPAEVLAIRYDDRVSEHAVDTETLTAPESPGTPEDFQVRWSDLDENWHANNIRYIEWVLESVPLAIRQESSLRALDIQFSSELLLGERVTSVSEGVNGEYRHRLAGGNGRVVALARSEWQAKSNGTF
ncbi:MAG TPA: acyl-ACP thioesterase domain-containing protein [Bryobacteraceae bacterium]|nr:acyl-ACP thioesterase domain-containing protein [Bryobacteraceae bacterium]